MKPSADPISTSSSSSSSATTAAASSSRFLDPRPPAAASSAATDDPSPVTAAPSTVARDAGSVGNGGGGGDAVDVERRSEHSAVCRWTVAGFPRVKARALWSRYFEVGGYDCRLLIYPKGDSQALPGYLSVYLQIVDPRGPSSSSSNKWDCFASYRLYLPNHLDDAKSVSRDSWHRFSSKKKSHGWCDFAPTSALIDPCSGFLVLPSDSLVVAADILLLHESVAFVNDSSLPPPQLPPPATTVATPSNDALSGKFTWKVHNFSLFREMIKTQKIMSPVFPAGECNLRISVYQSAVAGVEYLSMCLESKDTEKVPAAAGSAAAAATVASAAPERSCWCIFRMSVLNQRPGTNHVHRDSYGRFAADNKGGDNISLGWNDYMRMTDFIAPDTGFLVDNTAVFSTSFHVIRESNSFTKNAGMLLSNIGGGRNAARKLDGHFGKFTWRIENFSKLKDLLKKRKITGLCIKSRRFQIGNRDCRLIVYPRGQSQPPCHLSVFLEVTDSHNTVNDWSCFVSHRLSVVNQKVEEKSITKESQNRYSKSAKDWGWREFVTLTSLFDLEAGFLVQDTVIFSAEVLILKETSTIHEFSDSESETGGMLLGSRADAIWKRGSFTWRVENFLSFKDIMETRKIFSKFFQAGSCELRIGVYESFDTICIYLESDQSSGSDPDKNFWVRYRMAVINQKNPAKTVWKESSICTKTWSNSVLQFMKVSDLMEPDAGFLVRDTVVFVCEIMDCCPWFEFSDLEENHLKSCGPRRYEDANDEPQIFMVRYFRNSTEVNLEGKHKSIWDEMKRRAQNNLFDQETKHASQLVARYNGSESVEEVLASDDEQDAFSTDSDELIESEDGEGISGDEEDMFRNLLSRAGFHLTYGDNPSHPQVTLREKLLMDAGAISGFLTGLRVYLDDPAKVKRLLLPTRLAACNAGKKDPSRGDANSPSLMNLLMGVKVLQQAIIDLLLDIMVECCQPSEERAGFDSSETNPKQCPDSGGDGTDKSPESSGDAIATAECTRCDMYRRLDSGAEEITQTSAVRCSYTNATEIADKTIQEFPIVPPQTSSQDHQADDSFTRASKLQTNWTEQSEELLGLIVNSMRALDNSVPQGCPEPRRRPQAIRKIALVLDKAPKHLQPDLIDLVPKLIDHSEHSLAANALLNHLQKPDSEPALRIQGFGALNQLAFGNEDCERILYQAFELLADSNDEPLVATINFIFKAASQCQHVPQAVRAIRLRLKTLGPDVPQCVLDILAKTTHKSADVAEAILKGIESDHLCDENCIRTFCGDFTFGVNGLSPEIMSVAQEQAVQGCYLTDIYLLIEILSISSLFAEALRIFERAILQGTIRLQSVAMILEGRHARRINNRSRSAVGDSPDKQLFEDGIEPLPAQEVDFTLVISLGEMLSFSKDTRVQDFVRMLYAIMFKIYAEEHYRFRMLKGLVERATNTSESCRAVDIDMDVLIFLVREEDGIARPVLNMLREIAEVAQIECANLWHQLCAVEDENIQYRDAKETDLANFSHEKAAITKKLDESEVANNCLKSELKAELERFAREKKELAEQKVEIENQLEWVRAEKDEEIIKISADRRALQDRLHDAETQHSQLKSRRRDELKKVVKEKNTLAERLRNAEAARKRFDEESKRYASESVSREEVRQSLEAEVRRLTQTVGQTEDEKREKEEQIARCEAYIDGMEAKLQTCEQYIHTLEVQLQEEMSRHAPLYGAGLEALSTQELETVAHIHEEGLRQIHAIQQKKSSGNSLVSGHSPQQVHGFFTTTPLPVGMPRIIPNNVGTHGNGHMNGAVGPWFNPT